MTEPASRRRFLQLAGTSLALAGTGLAGAAPPALAQPRPSPAPSAASAGEPAGGPVLLNFNECPYGPSEAAARAARDSVASSGRYRFALAAELQDAFAAQAGVPRNHVALYPGSSEPLNRAATLWTGPDAALVVADPTFEALGDLATARGARVIKVPLRADGAHDVEAMVVAAQRQPTGLIYLCNPNNPTGTITPADDIAWLLQHKPAGSIVLVDEAYLQYSSQASLMERITARDDVVILRTFSKLYGMAGMRLGVAAATPSRLAELARLGANPLPVPAMAAGLASLRDADLVASRSEENARIRQGTIAWLGKRGYTCTVSEANCFMVDVQGDGTAFTRAMTARGVVIGRSWPIWPTWVRVTVGTEDEMAAFRRAFAEVAGISAG